MSNLTTDLDTPSPELTGVPVIPSHSRRRTLHLPITLSVALMSLNVTLMICWIVLLAQHSYWGTMSIGVVAFALMLVGLSIYLVLTVKAVNLNRRQANFVDSVTHELKSPIAALKLYLETLQMRSLSEPQRDEFLETMRGELDRLDQLINHLLEVARLDAIGLESEPEVVELGPLVESCAQKVAIRHRVPLETFRFEIPPTQCTVRRGVLEIVVSNLLDNAVKYGGSPPEVIVRAGPRYRSWVTVRVLDNGEGIPPEFHKKIFQIFYRRGSELERTRTGTGLGLYIVKILVGSLKGRVHVRNRTDASGTQFEVDLPGRVMD